MNLSSEMKLSLLILSLYPVLIFGQNKICDNLITQNFDSCSGEINTYFINNNSDSLSQNNIALKFNELDSFIEFIINLNCIDTAYYRDGRGFVMKTGILMTDIVLVSDINDRYMLRLMFKNYTEVAFLRKWED